MTSWTDYQDDISDAISDSMDVDWSASVGAQAVVAWLNEHKPLPAAPAPEGGAVDDEALKIATELHTAFEKLIYGLPKYLDTENLTDEENMIREAWVTLDVTAHRLAALATHEEAPAEAGERIVGTIAHVSNGRSELPELIASALRAQPPAREDAQPVGYGDQLELEMVKHGHAATVVPSPDDRFTQPLYTHPAPDALRVAANRAQAILQRISDHNAYELYADHYREIDQALAALQAEQK